MPHASSPEQDRTIRRSIPAQHTGQEDGQAELSYAGRQDGRDCYAWTVRIPGSQEVFSSTGPEDWLKAPLVTSRSDDELVADLLVFVAFQNDPERAATQSEPFLTLTAAAAALEENADQRPERE